MQQTSETTLAMGSAGSARLNTSVHDCRWLRRVTDQCWVTAAAVSAISIAVIAPTLHLVLQSAAGCRTPSSLVTSVAGWQCPAVTHQASAEVASLEQATTTLNDSNAISCTVPVFPGNSAVPMFHTQLIGNGKWPGFPGTRETGARECKPYS